MFVRNRTGFETVQWNLFEVSPQQFFRITNAAFCWKIQYGFRSSSELPQDHARGLDLSAEHKFAIPLGRKKQVGIPRESSRDHSRSCPQGSKSRSPTQNPSPPFINRSSSSSGKWYFISQNFKRSPTIIYPDYFIVNKSQFHDPSLSKVHFLYSPKNTELCTPRHVGDSVNQRLCQAIPAAGMISVTK
ncbi:hypothetical protein AVEN_110697-1 [Araneus ventricosus]|uniref:Uncharacterized protein n=1 Tax=Araneus ventricosus TaxID=182803 RepID=A0A4Y2AUM2_ARAVE|nr:hypothetical protein AVEN_110697-1 [Araneus ventricosus]